MVAPLHTSPSVLVVDDDQTFCAIMRELLKRFGLEVYLAYSVEEALSTLGGLIPDLVLTDVMMPEVSGLTLVRHLRDTPSLASIPRIVISARALPVERATALEAGADVFIAKPFSFKKLESILKPILAAG